MKESMLMNFELIIENKWKVDLGGVKWWGIG